MSTNLEIKNAYVRYQTERLPTLNHIDLTLPKKRWTCLLGQSGQGKSTLLRLLAGLIEPEHDSSFEVNEPDYVSNLAYMAQQDLLMPWLTVLDNVLLSIRLKGSRPTQSQYEQAYYLLNCVGLSKQALSFPKELSGGMRQRVAIARTLMQNAPFILMDEPFSALDAVTRHQLQEFTYELLNDKTVLLITHDPLEALRLGDKILLLSSEIQVMPVPSTPPLRTLNQEMLMYQEQLLQALVGEHAA